MLVCSDCIETYLRVDNQADMVAVRAQNGIGEPF